MKIGRMTVEWFGSVKSMDYNFNKAGLNLIAGENGAGKTSIFNALYWCLYGKLLKEDCWVEPWNHVQDDMYVGTRVAVRIRKKKDENYWVVRCKDFDGKVGNRRGGDGLYIFRVEGGNELNIKGKAEKQKWIEKFLGYSADLFRTVIIFPQEIGKLMDEDGPGKKKIFEEAFEASFISRAKDNIDKKLKDQEQKLFKVKAILDSHRLNVQFKRKELKSAKATIKNFEIERQERIKGIQSKINKAEDEFDKIGYKPKIHKKIKNEIVFVQDAIKENTQKTNEKLSEQEFKIDFQIKGRQSVLESSDYELRDLIKNRKKICPTCGRGYERGGRQQRIKDLKKVIGELKERIAEMNTEYLQIQKKINSEKKIKERIKDLNEELGKLTQQSALLEKDKDRIDNLKEKLAEYDKDIKRAKKEELMLSLDDLRKEYKALKLKESELKENHRAILKDYQLSAWLIKDPLSNAGLKAYIFNTMIGLVNNELKKYSEFIGFNVKVFVDLESSRKDIHIIINKKGDNIIFGNLSKGQKQLTNVALIFALNDTITKNKPINILLMDEPFESLSKSNIEKVASIIQNKSIDNSVHLITHLNSLVLNYRNSVNLILNDRGLTELQQ